MARGEVFRLEDIKVEVRIWHGEQDRNDPAAMARAQERPRSRVTAVDALPAAPVISQPGWGCSRRPS
jgi:hypothetical protein